MLHTLTASLGASVALVGALHGLHKRRQRKHKAKLLADSLAWQHSLLLDQDESITDSLVCLHAMVSHQQCLLRVRGPNLSMDSSEPHEVVLAEWDTALEAATGRV